MFIFVVPKMMMQGMWQRLGFKVPITHIETPVQIEYENDYKSLLRYDGILYRLLIVLPHQLFDWLSRHHLIPAHAVDPQRDAEYWVHLKTMTVPNERHFTRAPYTTLGLGIWSQVFGIRAVFLVLGFVMDDDPKGKLLLHILRNCMCIKKNNPLDPQAAAQGPVRVPDMQGLGGKSFVERDSSLSSKSQPIP